MDELTGFSYFDTIKYNIPQNFFIQIEQPEYKYLKVIPSCSLRNYRSDGLIKVIAGLYRDTFTRIKKEHGKLHWIYNIQSKVGFYIYIEKHKKNEDSKVNFFFAVPLLHYTLFKDKIIATWGKDITLVEVDTLPTLNMKCTKYQLKYQENNCKSLATDKRNNTLITNELSVLYSMDDGDKAGIFFNFIPTEQRKWRAQYDKAIMNLKNDLPTSNNKAIYFGLQILNAFIKACDILLSSISLGNNDTKKTNDFIISDASKKKKKDLVVDTQIVLLGESKNKKQEENIVISLGESFSCLSEDYGNQLTYTKVKKKASDNMNFNVSKIKGVSVMKSSSMESQNYISLPANELLEEHQCIEHINVLLMIFQKI
jgi:hypothetical protein